MTMPSETAVMYFSYTLSFLCISCIIYALSKLKRNGKIVINLKFYSYTITKDLFKSANAVGWMIGLSTPVINLLAVSMGGCMVIIFFVLFIIPQLVSKLCLKFIGEKHD